jgi:adhesin transport system outer membrane protein
VREQLHRADEVHGRLFERTRAAEEDVRSAWSRLQNQTALVTELETQQRISDDLLLSYREQFNIGRRSLLDVLDAQNTRYNVQAQTETARLAKLYAQYRVLAAQNRLVECMGLQKATAAYGNERAQFKVNPIPPSDLQENSMPMPAMGPPQDPNTPHIAPPATGSASAAAAPATTTTVASVEAPAGR